MTVTGKVRVQVVIDVDLDAAWGGDCTLEQVQAQGTREASARIAQALQGARGVRTVSVATGDVIVHWESRKP